ncbi:MULTISPECIES: hypothetical protein [unclassified Saccharibacter]|uniref:hypothetical protein n=1 Tax=unclassified Saccharibacter TaxID=2648722 RepID=UPI0013292928|nr:MULTISPECIES: hypothetical protein [unclassified Saccharibacter]MXV36842.1 hypothetical protein [Saccharibacter sp. EH611]MXV58668.1 hypothetical protein [Saccharibacter sp. EH70]MXV66174.1 hypothetical protein [Saccharibacter sp. EH60]
MRYYNLCIYSPGTDPSSQPVLQFASTTAPKRPGTPQSVPGGSPTDPFDPGALDISFRFTQASLSKAEGSTGGAFVTIKGVDITTINQASNLVNHTLILKAGMSKGLPLSNPNQVGTILHGTIQSSLGNWSGTEMDITFFVSSYQAPELDPTQISYIFHCPRGKSVKEMIKQTTFPAPHKPSIVFKAKEEPIALHDFIGCYTSFKELCVGYGDCWKQMSGNPLTVHISGQTITFLDQFYERPIKKIDFNDLMGQPTWNGKNDITVTCPLRGDIQIGDLISLPSTTNYLGKYSGQFSAQKQTLPKNSSLFSGTFEVTDISYLGSFREKDGQQWQSAITCNPHPSNDKKSLLRLPK